MADNDNVDSWEDSWEERAFAEDTSNGAQWPPRSYPYIFCKRNFRTPQALGGHMNLHRPREPQQILTKLEELRNYHHNMLPTAGSVAGDDVTAAASEIYHQAASHCNWDLASLSTHLLGPDPTPASGTAEFMFWPQPMFHRPSSPTTANHSWEIASLLPLMQDPPTPELLSGSTSVGMTNCSAVVPLPELIFSDTPVVDDMLCGKSSRSLCGHAFQPYKRPGCKGGGEVNLRRFKIQHLEDSRGMDLELRLNQFKAPAVDDDSRGLDRSD